MSESRGQVISVMPVSRLRVWQSRTQSFANCANDWGTRIVLATRLLISVEVVSLSYKIVYIFKSG